MNFGEHIIYVDESGDHSLASIDQDYPIFVLSFCIFRKSDYVSAVVPRLQELKFRWFGHDLVILHENEITKKKGPFSFLQFDNLRGRFLRELTDIMADAPMTVIAAVIRKEPLKRRYSASENPYQLALLFCLERAYEFLAAQGDNTGLTHIVCEARSPREKDGVGKEDRELKLEFERIVSGKHKLQREDGAGAMPCFDILFASKKVNSAGLQIADLIARPIGLNVLRPEQSNRAFDVIDTKIWRGANSASKGCGLKIFP